MPAYKNNSKKAPFYCEVKLEGETTRLLTNL